ncbi:MAG TPA: hypothetical protein VGQ83_06510 [Polyangia bacterium]
MLKTRAEVTTAFAERAASIFVAVHADSWLRWLARSAPYQGRHRLLVLDRLDEARGEVLRGLFASVVVPHGALRLLPPDELAEAVAAPNAADLIIGGVVDAGAGVIRFIKGDLVSLVVPVTTFKPTHRGASRPDFEAMELTDYGQTVKLGSYEAGADAILYEHDPEYRRRAKARLRVSDTSFGGSLRRLRLQRGLGRADFPGIAAKEIARIERGEVKKPHASTITAIAAALSVRPEDVGTY